MQSTKNQLNNIIISLTQTRLNFDSTLRQLHDVPLSENKRIAYIKRNIKSVACEVERLILSLDNNK